MHDLSACLLTCPRASCKEIDQKEYDKTNNGDEAIGNVNMEKYKGHNADESQTFIIGPNRFNDLTLDYFDALATFSFTKL